MERVVVTGVGPLTAIGCGRNEYWDALIAGRHGFGPITLCDPTGSSSSIAAEVKDFRLSRYIQGGDTLARHTPRPVQFALAAAVLALHDAELDLDACDPDRFGVQVGTSLGNIETLLACAARHTRGGLVPAHVAFHVFAHSAACNLASFFNIRGPIHTTTTGCNSGLDALGQAMRSIQTGACDLILVVGTDCEVVPEVLAALSASNSLSTRYDDEPGRASRPFDLERDGNVLGEGAGALLVESERHALARQARIYARVAGFGASSSGHRQYSHDKPKLDVQPSSRAMKLAIAEAGWTPEDVELVNANGSSSVVYDRVEALALAHTFGTHFPELPVHSQKSMLGQHGAGSSALQAITACLTIRRGTAFPTINHETKDPSCGPLRVITEATELHPERVLAHSIGLGGFYYSSAAFESPDGDDVLQTGKITVQWSAQKSRRFQPLDEYQRPLTPFASRGEGGSEFENPL